MDLLHCGVRCWKVEWTPAVHTVCIGVYDIVFLFVFFASLLTTVLYSSPIAHHLLPLALRVTVQKSFLWWCIDANSHEMIIDFAPRTVRQVFTVTHFEWSERQHVSDLSLAVCSLVSSKSDFFCTALLGHPAENYLFLEGFNSEDHYSCIFESIFRMGWRLSYK